MHVDIARPNVAAPAIPSRTKTALDACWRGIRLVAHLIQQGTDWIFGLLAIVIGLAILAAMPLAQFLTLGYLLESSGRVARTGRITSGFVGVRKAARVGSLVAGVWLLMLPLRWASSMWEASYLIDPGSKQTADWKIAVIALGIVLGIHGIAACYRGGRVRHFLIPVVSPRKLWRRLRSPGIYRDARDAVWNFVVGLHLPHYFWLGLRCFIGGLAWLFIPVLLFGRGQYSSVAGWIGAILLGFLVLLLPMLEAHFAAKNRFAALFQFRQMRDIYARAPLAWWLAITVTLLSAVPLYILKIEIIPREAAWLPSVLFVVFIWPARLLAGWAYSRSERRVEPRMRLSRILGRIGMVPVAAFYVLILFVTQYTAWNGALSLYEQHAFLVPVPFLDM